MVEEAFAGDVERLRLKPVAGKSQVTDFLGRRMPPGVMRVVRPTMQRVLLGVESIWTLL